MPTRSLFGFEQTYASSLYRAAGFTDRHFAGPLVGIINSYCYANPDHAHLARVCEVIRATVAAAGAISVKSGIPAPCDGICDGRG